MDNYETMLSAAKQRFCTYDMAQIAAKTGIISTNTHLHTTFLGETVQVEKSTGEAVVGGRRASFGEGLTLFDWLCDRKENARAAWRFCPVSSLPGVLVSGGSLTMRPTAAADKIDKDPEKFIAFCQAIGGTATGAGDIGFQIWAFPDLPMQLKFYRADEEFPASLTLLFDANTLQFIRYETVYYLAGCLLRRIESFLD